MSTRNDITGDAIQSKPSNQTYRDNHDKIFGKKEETPDEVSDKETEQNHENDELRR